jgi:heterodisulfide reductase subunit B
MIGYYPGCTLKSKAKNLEDSALACLSALGIEYKELERWNCCGAVFSLANDDLIHHVAPVRDLIRAKDAGHKQVVTLCSMCYNTLARANRLMKEDEEKRKTINLFMSEETDYFGEVEVVHYLDFLKREVGWEKLKRAIRIPLKGLKVAPYYGCTLLRPNEVAIESPERPTMFAEFLTALGAEPIDFPASTKCCSSYQIIANESAALLATTDILKAATRHGAEAMALSCPVCEYNLGRRQNDVRGGGNEINELPTFYFTQLLAVALGLPIAALGLKLNEISSEKLLRDKQFISAEAAVL